VRTWIVVISALIWFWCYVCLGQVSVTTHHNDVSRTGQNLSETVLNTSNVSVNTFGKLFSRAVDGQVYAQPLYVPNLSVGGKVRNVVFVATQNDSVYAFDADDPAASSPLWQSNFLTPNTLTPVPSIDVDPACKDITPQIGITSTPVIDPSTNTIYVVAKTKDTTNTTYHFQIHALDLITGAEKFGGPTEIAAQVPGIGVDNVGGIVTFTPLQQFNRPGLLLLNGTVYAAFGSACETPPWHGWIFGYDALTLQQTSVLNLSPNGSDAGVWGGGQGLLADASGNIYVMTGNGTFDGITEFGDSFVKIGTSGGLTVLDYFTPKNQLALNAIDSDLGSGAPVALPNTNLIVGSGKDRVVRVIDTTNMGKFDPLANHDVQEFPGVTNQQFMGAPIYWNSPNHGPVIYMWGPNDVLKAFQFSNGQFGNPPAPVSPVMQGTVLEAIGSSNSVPLSLSATGSQAGTGIVWASGALTGNANQQTRAGILRAFDATDLTKLLWDSTQNLARDNVGNYAKFSPPMIANGKVYLATFSNQLLVYGLLPDFGIAATPASVDVSPGQSATYNLTVQPANGFSSAVTLSCSGLPASVTCSFSPAAPTPTVSAATSTLTVSTSASTPIASSTVTITGTSGALVHSTTVTLNVADFALSSTPTTATVKAGSPTSFTIAVQALGNFSGSVALACSGLPAKSSCSFSPSQVAGSGNSTLAIATTAPIAAQVLPAPSSDRPTLYAIWLPLFGLTLAGIGAASSNKAIVVRSLLLCFFVCLALAHISCGGSYSTTPPPVTTPGTPAGTYTVTITGTASVSHSTPVTLVVQ